RAAPPTAASWSRSPAAPPPPDISTLSLHDALPIFLNGFGEVWRAESDAKLREYTQAHVGCLTPLLLFELAHEGRPTAPMKRRQADRKSTRLNSSHDQISYAVFCLKKQQRHDHRVDL